MQGGTTPAPVSYLHPSLHTALKGDQRKTMYSAARGQSQWSSVTRGETHLTTLSRPRFQRGRCLAGTTRRWWSGPTQSEIFLVKLAATGCSYFQILRMLHDMTYAQPALL